MANYVLNSEFLRELDELKSNSLGVVQKDSSAAMSETSRTLIVGLGGMGIRTVAQLKHMLTERIGKVDDRDIKFLAIDTSRTDINNLVNNGILAENETQLVFNANLGNILHLPEDIRPVAIKGIMPPPSANFNPELAGEGAAQKRLSGRLSLMDVDTYYSLTTKIKNLISDLRNFVSHSLDIHVVAGIGGGTGSGLVVDIPYIVRKVAAELSVPDNKVHVFGHVYLPNVYDQGGVGSLERAHGNGYAALKEIDYYMNISTYGETFDTIYPDSPYSSHKNIFDFCTLIGGKSSAAKIEKDPKQAAVDTCVSNLVNQVTRVLSAKPDKEGDIQSISSSFTAKAFLDNTDSTLSNLFKNDALNFPCGENYKYAYVGSSVIKFPSDAIVEYIVGTTLEKSIKRLKSNGARIKQEDVDKFERGILTPADAVRVAVDELEAKINEIFAEKTWNKSLIANAASTLDIILKQAVEESLGAFDKDEKMVENAITRANQRAEEIFTDPNRGPFYLAELLTSNSASGGTVTGFYEKLASYGRLANKKASECTDNIRTTNENRSKLEESMQGLFGFSKGKIEDYKTLLIELYKNRLLEKLYTRLAEDYYLDMNHSGSACVRIKRSLDKYYLAHADMLDRICDITKENAEKAHAEINSKDTKDSIFAVDSKDFEQLKVDVLRAVDKKTAAFDDEQERKLGAAILDAITKSKEDWVLADDTALGASKCAKSFREFVKGYPFYSEIVSKTFIDYLDDAFAHSLPAEKSNIINHLLGALETSGAPMINVWDTFSLNSVKDLCYRYVIIPSRLKDEWNKIFEDCLGQSKNNIIYKSPDQNAIYNYTMYASMPIWIHADLVKYEKEYGKQLDLPANHINESAAFFPPYKDYPSLMVPSQWYRTASGLLSYSNPAEIKIREEVKDLVEFCMEYGIIHINNTGDGSNQYIIELLNNIDDTAKMERFLESYEEDNDNYDENGLLKGKADLYAALCKSKFGGSTIKPIRCHRLAPTSLENVVELIRKQMRLYGELLKFREKLMTEDSIFVKVDEINKGKVGAKKNERVFRYMLYSLISPNERGVWEYHLGDNSFKIVSKLDVSSSDSPELIEYMEMAVCKYFYQLDRCDDHMPLLDAKVAAKNASIDAGASMDSIKEVYASLRGKADDIVTKLQIKASNGDRLKKPEVAARDFYSGMLKFLDKAMALFA